LAADQWSGRFANQRDNERGRLLVKRNGIVEAFVVDSFNLRPDNVVQGQDVVSDMVDGPGTYKFAAGFVTEDGRLNFDT
jgi:hypothetical protein